MAEKIKTQEEPSIEEILGSIRRIIAEDEDDDVPETKADSAALTDAAADDGNDTADVSLALDDSMSEEIEEEPLELTNKIEPDGTIEHVEPVLEVAQPPVQQETMSVEEAKPMIDESTETQGTKPMQDTPSPAAQDALLSETTAEATTAVMAKLARQSALNDEGHNGATIETIIREMLRPMLKEWLDQNLPDLVQNMVERELEKLTKRL